MRLITCGWEVGSPVDGFPDNSHIADFDDLNGANQRSGDHALKVSSGTGVPDGSSTSLITSASLNRQWSWGANPFTLSEPSPGGLSGKYLQTQGFVLRTYVRWNTGDLPAASKAVEFIKTTNMDDSSLFGRTALCIDHLGQLQWKADARPTLSADGTPSTIVPNGYLISAPLTLDAWHMIEIAITQNMECVRLEGDIIFTRCHLSSFALRPDIRVGWNVVYSGGGVVNNTGSMGASKNVYFDDFALNDIFDDGSGQDGWPGVGRVQVVRPNADLGSDYSWAPGGPQSIWFGSQNGTLNDAVAETPHPITPPPTPPKFFEALNNLPLHTPSGSDLGASAQWTGAFSGLPKGYGTFLTQTNPYENGVPCPYPPLAHDGIWYPGERNLDAFGVETYTYMATSGASDWRAQAGVGRLGTFPPGVFHPDTEFISPRAGGQDALEMTCTEPTISGTVLLTQAWMRLGDTTGSGGSVPRPPGETATPGLKLWLPDFESEPADKTTVLAGDVQMEEPIYGVAFAGDPMITLKRTTSIRAPHANPYFGGGSMTVYGAGIIVEDMSEGGEALPETCNPLLIIV